MTTPLERLTTAVGDRYRIERELGAGGMATVYLAHDVRHDRKVALKVLRPELSAILGGERFLAEIKTTANLQHPHILSLFDSGEADGLVFYVMPYVQGESLRDRLNREKQLPVDDAVRLAREVASALDYAHRQGVVHRDIKPENVLLHDGSALVADFGIALAVSRSDGGTRMTETGMSLGTPHYMAPEQAMGEREITAKADIYAVGCVLYEMLTGEPPFTGPTAQAIVARVMTEEPRSLTLQRRTVPPHVEGAVQVALSKLPADRFATAAQFADAITRPGTLPTMPAAAAPVERRHVRWPFAAGLLGTLVLGLAGGWVLRRGAPERPLGRFTIDVAPLTAMVSAFVPQIALSPDGRTIAFVGRGPGGGRIFVRALSDSVPVPVAGTDQGVGPFFSPDGTELGFSSQQRLLKVPLSGGAPSVVAESAGTVATWLRDGSVLHTDVTGRALVLTQPDGTRRRVVSSDTGLFANLSTLPKAGTVLAVLVHGGRDRASVVAVSLRDGATRPVGLEDAVNAKYVEPGLVLYQPRTGGPVMAVPFDAGRLRVTGPGRPVAPPARIVFRIIPLWDATADAIVFVPPEPARLVLVDRLGLEQTLREEPRTYHHPRFSPDGRRVALDITDPDARDIWVADVQGQTMSRLTVGETANDPFWSPDGQRIAYTSARSAIRGVWIRNVDGSGGADSVLTDLQDRSSGSWSRDGTTIVSSTGMAAGLQIVPLAPRGAARSVPGSRPTEAHPALSPDGRWLAYVSDESGRLEVYVRPFPGPGGRQQVSVSGGTEPVWGRDGGTLFYREDAGVHSRMMAAAVRAAPAFQVLTRASLFDMSDYVAAEDHANFDVSPDGSRFVLVRSPQATKIQLVENWQRQLEGGRR